MENIQKAAALKYDRLKDIAPKLVAKGKGLVAENILDLAKKKSIPVYKDDKLIDKLIGLELNEVIPEELYNIVAEVLAFIAKIDNNY